MYSPPKLQLSTLFLSMMSVSSVNVAYAAKNFSIVPTSGYVFPTKIYQGTTVRAYYTITNLTNSTQQGYRIQGLPLTVTQDTSSTANCPAVITLVAGGSCTLQLNITGEAISNFALCNGANCTAACTPLNVVSTVIPNTAGVTAGSYMDSESNLYPLLASNINDNVWSYTIGNTPALPTPCETNGGASFASASCSGANCVAVGNCHSLTGFVDPQGDKLLTHIPLLATSTNGGGSWSYIPQTPLPSSCMVGGQAEGGARFVSTSCSGQNCVAAGYCNSQLGSGAPPIYAPLLATSLNGGTSWSYTITLDTPTLPSICSVYGNADTGNASIVSASCSGQNCVAAGSCISEDGFELPLLAASQNGGATETWAYKIGGTVPSYCSAEGGAGFVSASCSGQNCVAAGYCTPNDNSPTVLPLLATSQSGGASWNYSTLSTLPSNCFVPSGGAGVAKFTSASCSGQTCVAAGNCIGSVSKPYQVPLLATSQNGGAWGYINTPPLLPSICATNANASLASVSCSGQTCIAAGSCVNSANNSVPILAESQAGGITGSWSYTISSIPSNCTAGAFFASANCQGLACLAAGSCITKSNPFPLLETSQDGGLTWSVVIDNNTPPALPTIATGGSFVTTTSPAAAAAATTATLFLLPRSLQFLSG